jgi:hypothetical protein
MPRTESPDLLHARKLLAEFEGDVASSAAHGKLAEALELLMEIADEEGDEAQLANNIGNAYATKVGRLAQGLLGKPAELSPANLQHWLDLLTEFGRCGIESAEVSNALAELRAHIATRFVGQLTTTQREQLLKRLEEEAGKG